MAEPKWTPGPWEIERGVAGGRTVIKRIGPVEAVSICDDTQAYTEEWLCVDEADAHLIAAAPDLYEACEVALERLRFLNSTVLRGMRSTIKAVEILEAALRKARGESDGD